MKKKVKKTLARFSFMVYSLFMVNQFNQLDAQSDIEKLARIGSDELTIDEPIAEQNESKNYGY